MFGQADAEQSLEAYDLADIQASGELIAATLSGPDTYYEYRGQGFGLQFMMVESFATSIGARLRMEMANDTADLFRRLQTGEVDLIALEMQPAAIHRYGEAAPFRLLKSQWVVRAGSERLADAADAWWKPQLRSRLLAAETARTSTNTRVRRHAQPAVLSRKDRTISHYDPLFIRHAQTLRWDWRLLAAQCYQESAFDPQAESWAGARGLMQVLPSTALALGYASADLEDPATNIEIGVRYLKQLIHQFTDIHDSHERIFFVLAAYNGGAGHVRDAMALARADGHQSLRWSVVEPYILALSDPQVYHRPQVQFGYLRGSETVDYVRKIRQRWQSYRGTARGHVSGVLPRATGKPSSRVKPRSEYISDSISIQ